MGLFNRDRSGGTTFIMREKLMSVGDDSWIDDENGNHVYKVDGKALRVRETFELKDMSGNVVAHIQDKPAHLRGVVDIERDGNRICSATKRVIGIRDHFKIEVDNGEDMSAKGNIVDHEYEIESDGNTVATVSKKWVRVRETYGIQIAEGQDIAMIIAISVAMESLVR